MPQRSSIMKLQYQTYWTQESDDDANLDWIRGFYDAMYGPDGPLPDGVMDGCYVNYPDVDLVRLAGALLPGRLREAPAGQGDAGIRGDVFNHANRCELPDAA